MRRVILKPLLLEELWKHKLLPHSRGYDSVGLGWDLIIYISSKFPGDIDANDIGTTLSTRLELKYYIWKWWNESDLRFKTYLDESQHMNYKNKIASRYICPIVILSFKNVD